MQSLHTPRYKLPLLATGQSNKELFHNEALTLLDFLVHPAVIAKHRDPDTLDPVEGEAWLIDDDPVGEWVARANQLALWTAGGWRFLEPQRNYQIFSADTGENFVFNNGEWVANGAIVDPEGGPVVDTEARQAIESILDALRLKGVILS